MRRFKLIVMIVSALLVAWNAMRADQVANRVEIESSISMNYLLYSPEGAASSDKEGQGYPLLLFLHGGGESGDDVELVKKHGPPMLVSQGKRFPFYILSPQNPYEKGFWDDRVVYQLLEQIIRSNPIDRNRIYLAGLSRGGYGAWRLAMNYPDKFAALIVVCAASAPKHYADRVNDLPVWIFHGVQDKTIPVTESIEMQAALMEAGNRAKLTLYQEAGHDSWTETFLNDSLYEWMLEQSR